MSTSITPNAKIVDIHMHLIPGVDDGAEDMMMARMMLLRAREQGIDTIFCTPHSKAFQYSEDKTRIYFDRLSENVCGTYPDMKLYLGCEVYCEAQMMKRVLNNLHCGRYPTMNGSPAPREASSGCMRMWNGNIRLTLPGAMLKDC